MPLSGGPVPPFWLEPGMGIYLPNPGRQKAPGGFNLSVFLGNGRYGLSPHLLLLTRETGVNLFLCSFFSAIEDGRWRTVWWKLSFIPLGPLSTLTFWKPTREQFWGVFFRGHNLRKILKTWCSSLSQKFNPSSLVCPRRVRVTDSSFPLESAYIRGPKAVGKCGKITFHWRLISKCRKPIDMGLIQCN